MTTLCSVVFASLTVVFFPSGPPPVVGRARQDFGESLLPHQRPLDQPILDPFLELELELAPPGSRIDPFAPHPPPPPPPPPPGVLSPPPRPRAEAASSQEGEQPHAAGRPRASEPVQHLVLDAAARGQSVAAVGWDSGDRAVTSSVIVRDSRMICDAFIVLEVP